MLQVLPEFLFPGILNRRLGRGSASGRLSKGLHGGLFHAVEGPAFAAACKIDRAVDSDPIEPGEELGVGLEFFERLVDTEKNFLRNLEGVFPIAYKTERDSVDSLPVFFEEKFKRLKKSSSKLRKIIKKFLYKLLN